VFGPGIGECVVAHIGGGDWIVVDSCIDRQLGQPVALEYLKSLEVDVATRVKLVVATHWHDDHIQGIAEILMAAKNAKFVHSAAYKFQELVRLVQLGTNTYVLRHERVRRRRRAPRTASPQRREARRAWAYSCPGK
jgi:glyoxylase-like metal-dependent hydrolase (beta-lactamase superfamily II)